MVQKDSSCENSGSQIIQNEQINQINSKNDELSGMQFEGRFIIKSKLTSGSFGKVYEGFDNLNGNKPIICKINDEKEMNKMEGQILNALNKKGFLNFPQILAVGVQAKQPY